MRRFLVPMLAVIAATSGPAQAESVADTPEVAADVQAAFAGPDRSLAEASFTRACDGFEKFLAAHPGSPLEREAKAKRAFACLQAGRDWDRAMNDLRSLSDSGPLDLARAFSHWALVERGERYLPKSGGDRARLALETLQAVSQRSTGRWGTEARSLYFRMCFAEIDRTGQVDPYVDRILAARPSPAERDHALYQRGRYQISGDAKQQRRAEEDLQGVAKGSSDWADDALYDLAQNREGKGRYTDALEMYQSLVARFSPTTSNRRSDAESRIADIKRPSLDLSVSYLELPGAKPQVAASWRNVKNGTFSVHRTDPRQLDTNGLFHRGGDEQMAGPSTKVVKSFTDPLSVPAPYTPGSKSFTLDVTDPGVYLVEAKADGLRSTAMVQITPLASVVKIGRGLAAILTADAVTGQGIPGAEVHFYVRDEDGKEDHLTGKSDDAGLAQIQLADRRVSTAYAWSGKGDAWALSTGSSNWYASDHKEVMAYVLADRPLYKPGETAGLKLFLRSRGAGPTVPVPDQAVTVSVHDASGREVQKKDVKTSRFGTAAWELVLGKDAQLGQWSVQVWGPSLSVSYQQGTFRVEEFKPPEYFVRVEPVGKPKPGQKAQAKVSAAFYFGGPVAEAQGRAIVTEKVWAHQWAKWEDELEPDPYSGYGYNDYDDERYVRRGGRWGWGWQPAAPPKTLVFKTGKDGTALLDLEASKDLPQETDREFAVQVFITDSSRREVTGSGSVRAARQPFFADLRADRLIYKPGERIGVKLRAEDANGNPESPSVEVRLLRLDEKGGSGEVLKRTAQLKDGRGRVELDADAVGACRLEARAPGAAASEPPLAQADLWLTSEVKPLVPPGMGFQLLTDRAPLRVGGTVRALAVTPTAGGHVLITLEGERLWKAVSLDVKGRARFVELPLSGNQTPNVWLTASRLELLQFLQAQRPVVVRGDDASLDVKVQFPKEKTEPGTEVGFKVALAGAGLNKAAAELAISIVDESIFAIEPEKADIGAFFTRRRQDMRVSTTASLQQRTFRPKEFKQAKEPPAPDSVADDRSAAAGLAAPAPASSAPSEKVEAERKDAKSEESPAKSPKAKREAGRDQGPADAPGAAPVKVRKNFGSSAGWFPTVPATVPGGGYSKATLPDSLTTWRAIAVAVTTGEHMGVGRGTIKTDKPLMVRLQAPRFFTERDEVTLSAVVTSRLAEKAAVDVSFDAPGLKPLGPLSQKVEVDAGGEARVDVRFAVNETGDRRVRVTARAPGAADAMEWTLPAVVHGSAQRQAFAAQLKETQSFTMKLPEKRNPAGTKLELTISPTLLGVTLDALPYLAQYPYGCVEQTLSRFVPASIAARMVKKTGVPSDRIPKDLDEMIDSGLKRLYGFQHSDGGWGWWQSDSTNRWMTAYAVYGLSLGREAGLTVDASVIERGRAYLLGHLGEALRIPDEHGFMLFALASTGSVPKKPLDQAFAQRTVMSPRARALLALSLLKAGDKRARIAVENLDDVVKAATARPDASVGEANDPWSTSAAIEATAYTLMAIYRYDPRSPLVQPLTDFLVLRRNGGKWRNTRDTAFAVYALSEIASKEESIAAAGSLSVLVNGRVAGKVTWKRGGLEMSQPVVLADSAFKAGENRVELRRDGAGTGYWSAIWDVYNQEENMKGVGGDVKIVRRFTVLGRPGGEKAAADMEYGMALDSGERVRVDVEVTANKAVEYVMIEDLKAAGLEAVMQKSGPEVCNYSCAHAELRSDRVAMFLTSLNVGTAKLSYELRAEVPGKFHALPARMEAMYAPEIRATSDEMRVEVRDAAGPGKGIATP